MRPSTTLSIIGFCNVLVGSVELISGVFVRLFLTVPSLEKNPALKRMFSSFPIVEDVIGNPSYNHWIWWTSPTDLVAAVAFLAAGYGLYSQKPWARLLSLICAAYMLVRSVLRAVILLWFVVGDGLGYAFTASSFGLEAIYPILLFLILNRPVIIEGLQHGERERAAAPSLRALSERHRRTSSLPRD